jgi:CheY-like chemotaxis protein
VDKNMTKIVMVVDDNPDIKFIIKRGLESSDENYKILYANNGKQCLELLENNQIPDLILLDIMMPGMDGWDVAAKIKENPKWSNIPLVFLTAKSDSFSQTFGGIVSEDYITKPFEIKDLKKRIERALKR